MGHFFPGITVDGPDCAQPTSRNVHPKDLEKPRDTMRKRVLQHTQDTGRTCTFCRMSPASVTSTLHPQSSAANRVWLLRLSASRSLFFLRSLESSECSVQRTLSGSLLSSLQAHPSGDSVQRLRSLCLRIHPCSPPWGETRLICSLPGASEGQSSVCWKAEATWSAGPLMVREEK